jgi:cysteine desulfurase
MRQVYFDHQSATPLAPDVLAAMQPFLTDAFGNPSSLHQHGLRARDAIATARAQIAALIHAESPEEIIFTSDGTESANLAVKGVAYASQRRGNHIVLSQIEHPAVIQSAEFLQSQGFTSTRVKVDRQGLIDPDEVRAAITDKTILISVHHVNHDIGAIEPIQRIGALAAERGIAFYADAEMSAGWMPVDVQALGADLLSFSPHRFYGPKGAGVLYRNRRARLAPILHGGAQEGGFRAGVENVAAIVGAGVAAEIALRELPRRGAHCAALQQRLWSGLKDGIAHLQLNGPPPGPGRVPTNLNFSTEFIEGEGQLLLCDMRGIAVASGSSCVSKSLKISHVLEAIGVEPMLGKGNLIVTLGQENSMDEVDYFIETFAKVVAKLRAMSPTWEEFQKGLIPSAIS